MNTEKMTIHKALCELKILDDRISKAQSAMPFVTCQKKQADTVSGVKLETYQNQVNAAYQKTRDLIARGNAIKRAVVLSNAKTTVVISDFIYTVAEAIYMKEHGIAYYKCLLETLESQYAAATKKAEQQNGEKLEARADDYIKSVYGTTSLKNISDEMNHARETFIESQTFVVIDPLDIKKCMEELEQFINDFTVNVDSALSVSNATTEIEISY